MSDKPATVDSHSDGRLEHLVQVLSRPLEFAAADDFAHLTTVKNLGPFLSSQVLQALGDRLYPPEVESHLIALRTLFEDFSPRLLPAVQRDRIATACRLLAHLRTLSQTLGELHDGSAPMSTTFPPGSDSPGDRAGLVKQEVKGRKAERRSEPETPLGGSETGFATADLLTVPIRYVKGVGPKRAVLLGKLGIRTVEDALWYIPWRYEDRSVISPIDGLAPDTSATVCGTIERVDLRAVGRRGLTVLEVVVGDSSGTITAVFFNQQYLERSLTPGTRVMLSGVVSPAQHRRGSLQMESPQYERVEADDDEPLHVGRIVPVYHETKGVTSRYLRTLIKQLLDQEAMHAVDVLPEALRQTYGFPSLQDAFRDVHFPSSIVAREDLDRGTTTGHGRLVYEELFVLELALASRHQAVCKELKGIRFDAETPMLRRLAAALPFQLTPAQLRVIQEIRADMGSSRPMNRLLQGDVGCGKTVVAVHAMVLACGSGYQAALMAPTEILAEQHYLALRDLLASLGLTVVLLKSRRQTRGRRDTLRAIETGHAQVIIGTHALIQTGVQFAHLGLAVIDEQHKFGVLQRKTLLEKGYRPDVLVMTATPIPRTLAMTVYGDLDVSVIDALPPGRSPVRTAVCTESQRRQAFDLVENEVRAGRQAYIVYPLVEESEKVDLQAAIQAADRLGSREFRWTSVGLLHGRLKPEEKESVMARFKAGEIRILVATTVIEVGVDVANATVMLIEHSERFGLAQLHQLRGRVGRGARQSHCLLMTSGRPPRLGRTPGTLYGVTTARSLAARRLEALVRSTDGFEIAEEDLRIRGPGEFFGVRQWGMPEFRAANLIRDALWLGRAREDAERLLQAAPSLEGHEALRASMMRRWGEKLDLGTVS